MKEVKVYLEEDEKNNRTLWVDDGVRKMRLWTLGFGVPVVVRLTTEQEDEEELKKQKERDLREYERSVKEREEREKRKRWWQF